MTKIKVSSTHIRQGRILPDSCPVALALADAGYPNTNVYASTAETFDEEGLEAYKLPRSVQRFIKKFDRGVARSTLKPFNFFLKT